jgi:hypothetical protein
LAARSSPIWACATELIARAVLQGPTMDPRAQAGLTRCTPSGCPQIPGVVGAARLYRDEDMTISGRPR